METLIADLRYKEVISVEDGSRFGYVGDMEIDLDSGQVRALVVPGRRRLFGLLGREEDQYIPWSAVRRFGEDIILVERRYPPPLPPQKRVIRTARRTRRRAIFIIPPRCRWRRTTAPAGPPAGPGWPTGPGCTPPAGGGTPPPGPARRRGTPGRS